MISTLERRYQLFENLKLYSLDSKVLLCLSNSWSDFNELTQALLVAASLLLLHSQKLATLFHDCFLELLNHQLHKQVFLKSDFCRYRLTRQDKHLHIHFACGANIKVLSWIVQHRYQLVYPFKVKPISFLWL